MATQNQIEANRRNAQRSTGPRSPEGKAISRCNALKHGLLASDITLPGEDQQEVQLLFDTLYDDYQPQGPVEEFLLRQVASTQHRLERAARIEAGLLADALHHVRNPLHLRELVTGAKNQDQAGQEPPPHGFNHEIGIAFNRERDALTRLHRHESALRRAHERALQSLEARIAQRLAAPPAPELQNQPISRNSGLPLFSRAQRVENGGCPNFLPNSPPTASPR
jgi:hypothetical protein